MVDAKKGIVVKQRDVVADNSIFREKVRAEKKHAFLNENFDFNPKNLICVTEKPTQKYDVTSGQSDQEIIDLKSKLSTLTAMPKQKFMYPQTAAQEVGWDMDSEFNTYVPKGSYGKKQCAETTYCDNFVLF